MKAIDKAYTFEEIYQSIYIDRPLTLPYGVYESVDDCDDFLSFDGAGFEVHKGYFNPIIIIKDRFIFKGHQSKYFKAKRLEADSHE